MVKWFCIQLRFHNDGNVFGIILIIRSYYIHINSAKHKLIIQIVTNYYYIPRRNDNIYIWEFSVKNY